MKAKSILALALSSTPVLAIPPENFGFPSAPNDTALSVTYMNNGVPFLVQAGELFGVNVPAQAPLISMNTALYSSLQTPQYTNYVVMMVDPDASYPENATNRFILHWLQGNLTKSNTDTFSTTALGGTQLVNSSAPVVPYRQPSPPTNSSAHRYILYAFQQPTVNFQIPSNYNQIIGGANRTRFNLTGFISDANLGTPVAAMYYYCSNMTQVPATYTAAAGATYPGGNGAMVTAGTATSTTGGSAASTTRSGSASSASGSAAATSSGAANAVRVLNAGEDIGFLAAVGMLLSWVL